MITITKDVFKAGWCWWLIKFEWWIDGDHRGRKILPRNRLTYLVCVVSWGEIEAVSWSSSFDTNRSGLFFGDNSLDGCGRLSATRCDEKTRERFIQSQIVSNPFLCPQGVSNIALFHLLSTTAPVVSIDQWLPHSNSCKTSRPHQQPTDWIVESLSSSWNALLLKWMHVDEGLTFN